VYRTRFLINAKQLTEAMTFMDVLGREHRGNAGDYLVESSDGSLRIAPRAIFEDVYVALEPNQKSPAVAKASQKNRFLHPAPLVSRQHALVLWKRPKLPACNKGESQHLRFMRLLYNM
jgi:hypothetical protein